MRRVNPGSLPQRERSVGTICSQLFLYKTNQWQLFFWLGVREGMNTQVNRAGGVPLAFWKWPEEIHCYRVCYPSHPAALWLLQLSGVLGLGGGSDSRVGGDESGLFYFRDCYGFWAHLVLHLPGGKDNVVFILGFWIHNVQHWVQHTEETQQGFVGRMITSINKYSIFANCL